MRIALLFAAMVIWTADAATAAPLELYVPDDSQPQPLIRQLNHWISTARPEAACEGVFAWPVPRALQPYIVAARTSCGERGIELMLQTRELRWLGQRVDEVSFTAIEADSVLRYRVRGSEAYLLKRWSARLPVGSKPELEGEKVHSRSRYQGALRESLDCSAGPCHFISWIH